MKKRILSFLVACVMVVSTFIISKPLVHVHAVESETTYVEDENQWTLPMNWYNGVEHDTYTDSDGKTWDLASIKNGLWKLTSFSNPDDFSTMTWNGTKDRSWIESYDNRLQASGAGAVANNWGAWYLSARHRWNGGSIFARGDSSTWMKVAMTTVKSGTYQIDENGEYVLSSNNKVEKGIGYVDTFSKNPAVVFTAPEAGTYSYSELVTANNLLDDSNLIDARDTAKRFAVNVTVRKEGVVINSFLLDEDNESNTLEGTVSLNKGERLAFVFSLATDDAKLGKDSTAETSRYALKLSDVVVKKTGEYVENIEVGATWDLPTDFYTCNPGAGQKINGHWQLANYDTQTQITYYDFQAAGSTHHANSWYFDCTKPAAGQCGTFAFGSRGFETNPGHANNTQMASAIIFTAPADGVYEFDVDTFSYGWKAAKNGSRAVIFFVMKDGVVYDITNPKYNQDNTENMTGTITLKKGEKIYFCAQRYTQYSQISGDSKDWPAWIGARYEGLTVEKVAELNAEYDFVTKYTFAPDGTSLAFGQFEMKAYDFTTKTASDAVLTTGESWSVKAASGNSLFWKSSVANSVVGWGPDGSTTNANEGAAIVFTAPADGTYNITGHFEKTYVKSTNGKHYCDYKIILADGTVVFDGTDFDETQLATLSKLNHTFGGTVELAKGEKVYIVKSPNASAVSGAQGGEIYALTVAQIGDVCEGNHTFVDGVCTVCDYECANHAWKNEDGACTVCGATHTHEGGEANCTTGAICDICKYVYTDVVADNHDWNAETGTCTHCGTGCEHDWMDGVCKTCGYECQHTGGTATCATRAICEVCHSYYGDTVANNHEREGQWVDDVDGCYLYYGCCYTSEPVQPHEYDDDADMTCNHCGHDRTVAVKKDDFAGVFEDVFGEGESDVVAEAPEENAFDNYAAVAGSKVDAYLGFNLELVGANADYVYLRHHILYNGGEVLVDGNEVALNKVSGNYYYFDVAVAIGDFDKAHVVTIDGDTIVTASVYSYMKTAYGSGTLNAEQTNLLNALYQWDKAVADATYNG